MATDLKGGVGSKLGLGCERGETLVLSFSGKIHAAIENFVCNGSHLGLLPPGPWSGVDGSSTGRFWTRGNTEVDLESAADTVSFFISRSTREPLPSTTNLCIFGSTWRRAHAECGRVRREAIFGDKPALEPLRVVGTVVLKKSGGYFPESGQNTESSICGNHQRVAEWALRRVLLAMLAMLPVTFPGLLVHFDCFDSQSPPDLPVVGTCRTRFMETSKSRKTRLSRSSRTKLSQS